MVFYLLDGIKQRFSRQLYGLLAIAALTFGTVVLGGVLIFNIVHKEPVTIVQPEGGISIDNRESIETSVSTDNTSEHNQEADGVVHGELPTDDSEANASEEYIEALSKDSIELYSVGDEKRP